MTHRHGLALLTAAALSGAVALAGCGSSKTETVSVSSAPSAGTTASSSVQAKKAAPPASGTTPAGATTHPSGTPAPRTRSAPAPAFARRQPSGEGLSAALAVVKAHGYTAADTAEYRSGQTLRVLVGTRTGSGDGHGQQAFFFVDGRYIGTDTSAPSASVKVLSQSDTEVTLAYPLYRPHDPLCCPGGGQAKVRFQLDNGRLAPLDPIPPASSSSGLSRG